MGYFGVKKSTNYFINTLLHQKALTLLESKNLSNFGIPSYLACNQTGDLIWTLNAGVKRFILWATGPLHNSMKNRNPYSCIYYFVDCYWLIILIFPPLKSVHSVTSTQMSKCSNTHQVTQNLRMRIFLYLWICYRNDKIILL